MKEPCKNHRYGLCYEASLLGTTATKTFECIDCGHQTGGEVGVALEGITEKAAVLYPRHTNECSDGTLFVKQVQFPEGHVEIHRPDGKIDKKQYA